MASAQTDTLVHILWINAGDSVALTATTQPSIEALV